VTARGRLEELRRKQTIAFARELLDRLNGLDDPHPVEREQVEGGECDDCRCTDPERWRYGRVLVCRPCMRKRMRARAESQRDIAVGPTRKTLDEMREVEQ
jgi:hypothetical protein